MLFAGLGQFVLEKSCSRGHESCVCMIMHGAPLDGSGSRSCAKTIKTSYIPCGKISYNERKKKKTKKKQKNKTKRSNSTVEETIVNEHVKRGGSFKVYSFILYFQKRANFSSVLFCFCFADFNGPIHEM